MAIGIDHIIEFYYLLKNCNIALIQHLTPIYQDAINYGCFYIVTVLSLSSTLNSHPQCIVTVK